MSTQSCPCDSPKSSLLATLAAAYDRVRTGFADDPQPTQQPALTLEARLQESRRAYHDAAAKLSDLEAAFGETDFSDAPIEVFQAREAEIRQEQNIVAAKQAAAAQIEHEWAQQREAEEKAFVQRQKQIRLSEVEAELTEIGKQIPVKQIELNRLPAEIETLRLRSCALQAERASLL